MFEAGKHYRIITLEPYENTWTTCESVSKVIGVEGNLIKLSAYSDEGTILNTNCWSFQSAKPVEISAEDEERWAEFT